MIASSPPDKLQCVSIDNIAVFRSLSNCGLAVCVLLLSCAGAHSACGQQIDNATAIAGIDAAVKARVDGIAQYTVTEHYKVFRGGEATQPTAEMVVKTTYRPETGKHYDIVSESGSGIVLKLGLRPLLDNEKAINEPDKVAMSWINSANYEMALKPGGPVEKEGRMCWELAIKPRRNAPNLINGTLWVDANDFSIVRLEGLSSKNPSMWSGPSHVMRQYTKMNGFAMATHARAESDSMFLGKIVVTIDYEDYRIQSQPRR